MMLFFHFISTIYSVEPCFAQQPKKLVFSIFMLINVRVRTQDRSFAPIGLRSQPFGFFAFLHSGWSKAEIKPREWRWTPPTAFLHFAPTHFFSCPPSTGLGHQLQMSQSTPHHEFVSQNGTVPSEKPRKAIFGASIDWLPTPHFPTLLAFQFITIWQEKDCRLHCCISNSSPIKSADNEKPWANGQKLNFICQ